MSTTTFFGTLQHHECGKCGIVFGMTPDHITNLRRSHETFYCPNGHARAFNGESDIQRAEKAAKRAQELLEIERRISASHADRADKTERKLTATRGYVTRIKNRVAAGVCPCCNRTFENLARHMKGQHPDYTAAKESPTQ